MKISSLQSGLRLLDCRAVRQDSARRYRRAGAQYADGEYVDVAYVRDGVTHAFVRGIR